MNVETVNMVMKGKPNIQVKIHKQQNNTTAVYNSTKKNQVKHQHNQHDQQLTGKIISRQVNIMLSEIMSRQVLSLHVMSKKNTN